MADVKKTEDYLEREFGIKNMEELEEESQRISDIDIGLFVTPIFWGEKKEYGTMNRKKGSITVHKEKSGNTTLVVLVVNEPESRSEYITRMARRAWRKYGRLVYWGGAIALGILLAEKASDIAYQFRGYEALGSEIFVLPVFMILAAVIESRLEM